MREQISSILFLLSLSPLFLIITLFDFPPQNCSLNNVSRKFNINKSERKLNETLSCHGDYTNLNISSCLPVQTHHRPVLFSILTVHILIAPYPATLVLSCSFSRSVTTLIGQQEECLRPTLVCSFERLVTAGGVSINRTDKNNRQIFAKNLKEFVVAVRPLLSYK